MDKGFDAPRVLSLELTLPQGRADFYDQLLERLSSLPGVTSAGAVDYLPLSTEGNHNPVLLEGDDPQKLTEQRPVANVRVATTDYFRTMGIPLKASRLFEGKDVSGAVVISEDLMHALWPTEELVHAIGRRVQLSPGQNPQTVVGVVGGVKMSGLDKKALPQIYRPHAQLRRSTMTVVVQTIGAPALLAPTVRRIIREMDANVAIPETKTIAQVVSASVAERRFHLLLIVLFASLALILAMVGIYGVIGHSVTQQTSQIGVRIAFGATSRRVLLSVFLQGMKPVLVGLTFGLAAAIISAQFLRALLFGVTPIDPISLLGVMILVLITSAAACYGPARRAALLNPITALRYE